MISIVSVLLFIYIIYKQFTDKIFAVDYNNNKLHWHTSEYFYKHNINNIRIPYLEFAINTPPRYHTYNQLPVM